MNISVTKIQNGYLLSVNRDDGGYERNYRGPTQIYCKDENDVAAAVKAKLLSKPAGSQLKKG